jgi:putative DNA primase/helicase
LGIGKVDSFRTTDVRAVLSPLVELASELKVVVFGIMHFNKKVDITNALLRISDSLAFGATSRHVYAVVDDAENKRKLVVKAKNNLAKAGQKALAYNFGQRDVGKDTVTEQTISAPYILWHAEPVDVTATEAMQTSRSPAARNEAKKFLADLLAAGPMPRKEIDEAAEGNGISARTLFRAKKELNIIAKKDAEHGGWTWRLPDERQYRNVVPDD